MKGSETIAALSSASGSSHIAIVRVSGPDSLTIVSSLCPGAGLDKTAGFHAAEAFLRVPGCGEAKCDIYIFRAPFSYTTEDVVELHFPGSPLLAERILLALAQKGARPAGPGEFTRRAFLGGRIDLAQAEAVCAVISARNDAELALGARALSGAVSEEISRASGRLENLLALVEASLDFSDQDIEIIPAGQVREQVEEVLALLERPASTAPEPRRDMLRVLICGMANVGKTSLFNCLLGKGRAIVSPIAGTTRDAVSAVLELGGTQILLFDTAGRKQRSEGVESLALSVVERFLDMTDIAVCVMEAHKKPSEGELEFYNSIGCPKFLVANKSDLGLADGLRECLNISCLTGRGIAELKESLTDMVRGGVERQPDALSLSFRQRDALARARGALERALESGAEELLAEDLREAIGALGEIAGKMVSDETLDRIFQQFCIGK